MLLDLTNYNSREFFIKYRNSLSLYYVFYNLYNNPNDTIYQRIYYNEIRDYYKDIYTIDYITKIYNISMFNRGFLLKCNKNPKPQTCNRNCHICNESVYDF
jgi:hypothetical protein